jgi:hypothetical protein
MTSLNKKDNLTAFKDSVWNIIRKVDLLGLVILTLPKSYLFAEGWLRSFHAGIPVDRKGKPLAWLSYPFIHFIAPRLTTEMRVFEYGCGFSTMWFSSRVKEIISVDHDKDWIERLKTYNISNSSVNYEGSPSSYASSIKKFGLFDIILIDGIERPLCFENAISSLTKGGVIIWDNSNRDEFLEIKTKLISMGYKVIDFHGLAPTEIIPTQTSVIYRTENCLGI